MIRNKRLSTSKFFLLLLILGLLMCAHEAWVAPKAQTVSNNILLFVTKTNDVQYKLDWTDSARPPACPQVFKIYRSEDPTVLGQKIANVNGTTYTDKVANPDIPVVYYYQVLRVNE